MKKKSSKSNKGGFARKFNKCKPIYDQLKSEAIYTLEKKLKESGIKIHSIPSKVKDLDSFLDKIERKKYENPFEQIQDFVGLRIICLFLSDIPKIGEIIGKCFTVVESEDNSPADCPVAAQFGFRHRLETSAADSELPICLEPSQKMPAHRAHQFQILNGSLPTVKTNHRLIFQNSA